MKVKDIEVGMVFAGMDGCQYEITSVDRTADNTVLRYKWIGHMPGKCSMRLDKKGEIAQHSNDNSTEKPESDWAVYRYEYGSPDKLIRPPLVVKPTAEKCIACCVYEYGDKSGHRAAELKLCYGCYNKWEGVRWLQSANFAKFLLTRREEAMTWTWRDNVNVNGGQQC